MNSSIICTLVRHGLPQQACTRQWPWPVPTASSTHAIRAAAQLLAAHALLHAARPPPDQPVPLERLVILDVFGELAERVARRRALCAAEEGHGVRPARRGVRGDRGTRLGLRCLLYKETAARGVLVWTAGCECGACVSWRLAAGDAVGHNTQPKSPRYWSFPVATLGRTSRSGNTVKDDD
jgi:hypothetical protein